MFDLEFKKNGKMDDYFNFDCLVDFDEDFKVVSEFKGLVLFIKFELEIEDF